MAPALRAEVLQFAEHDHAVIIAAPHLAIDAWSMQLCWNEIITDYARSPTAMQTETSWSFRRFVDWQNQQYLSGQFDDSIRYWQERWSALRETMMSADSFDIARASGTFMSLGTSVEYVDIGADTSRKVRNKAVSWRTTPSMLFLAVYAVLLTIRTGHFVTAPWLPFANRVRKETLRTVGWLANGHPVEVLCDPEMSLRHLFSRCRASVLGASQHQQFPRQFVWRSLGRGYESPSRFMFNYFRVPPECSGPSTLENVINAPLRAVIAPGASFSMRVVDRQESFVVGLIYGTGRFARRDVEASLRQYLTIIKQALHRSDDVKMATVLRECRTSH